MRNLVYDMRVFVSTLETSSLLLVSCVFGEVGRV